MKNNRLPLTTNPALMPAGNLAKGEVTKNRLRFETSFAWEMAGEVGNSARHS